MYKSEVVRYVPWRRHVGWGVSVFGVLLLASLAYYLGGYSSHVWLENLEQANVKQRQMLEKANHELAILRRQVASYELNVELGQRASEDLRLSLVDIETQKSDLEEQIAFYRGLMDPSMDGNLSFRGVKIEPLLNEGEFSLNAVVQQLSLSHSLVVGVVKWRIIGRYTNAIEPPPPGDIKDFVDGVDVELPASAFASGGAIKLRFKYFQNISDTVILPEGFTPSMLYLTVLTSGKDGEEVVSEFPWGKFKK